MKRLINIRFIKVYNNKLEHDGLWMVSGTNNIMVITFN
jgi:hypothetical protein